MKNELKVSVQKFPSKEEVKASFMEMIKEEWFDTTNIDEVMEELDLEHDTFIEVRFYTNFGVESANEETFSREILNKKYSKLLMYHDCEAIESDCDHREDLQDCLMTFEILEEPLSKEEIEMIELRDNLYKQVTLIRNSISSIKTRDMKMSWYNDAVTKLGEAVQEGKDKVCQICGRKATVSIPLEKKSDNYCRKCFNAFIKGK